MGSVHTYGPSCELSEGEGGMESKQRKPLVVLSDNNQRRPRVHISGRPYIADYTCSLVMGRAGRTMYCLQNDGECEITPSKDGDPAESGCALRTLTMELQKYLWE